MSCIVCGESLTGRRWKYCSDLCRSNFWKEYYESHYWGSLRDKILKERGYVCEKCGFQIKRVKNKIFPFEVIAPKDDPRYGLCFFFINQGSAFVVDHIVPVALGGTYIDTSGENLQVLCKRCNKEKTKKDMRNIYNFKRSHKALEGLYYLFHPGISKYWDVKHQQLISVYTDKAK